MTKDIVKFTIVTLIFTILSVIVYLIGINNPFITTGEAREALVAQSMLINDNLLHSIRYADDIATKPPFFHWCIFLLSKFTKSVTETTSRLPSLIFASIALIAWFIFIYKKLDKKIAIFTFFILLAAPEWYRHACLARVDATLAALITISFISLYNFTKKGEDFPLLSLFPLSLGTLTKGPIAIIIPLGATFFTMLLFKKLNLKAFLKLALLGVLSSIPWIVWLILQLESEGRNLIEMVLNENVSRFFDTMNKGEDPHSKNIFYLIGTFIAGFTPWSIFFLFEIKSIIKNRKSYLNDEYKFFFFWCLISLLFCLCFFMIPESKRSVYLLPIYPQASLILAITLLNLEKSCPNLVRRLVYFIGISFSFLLVFVVSLKYNFINIDYFRKYPSFEKFIFNVSLFQSDNFSFLLFLIYLLPIIFAYFVLTKHKEKKFYLLRFSFLFIVFFLYGKAMIINPASFKLSSKDFVYETLKENDVKEINMLTPRMYPVVFYIRSFNNDIYVRDYDKNLVKQNNIFLWKSDEELLNEKYFYKITTSQNYIEKHKRLLEFAKLRNYENKFLK